jgi:hypothetical protein
VFAEQRLAKNCRNEIVEKEEQLKPCTDAGAGRVIEWNDLSMQGALN